MFRIFEVMHVPGRGLPVKQASKVLFDTPMKAVNAFMGYAAFSPAIEMHVASHDDTNCLDPIYSMDLRNGPGHQKTLRKMAAKKLITIMNAADMRRLMLPRLTDRT